jgi:hypothetical protein
LIFPLPIRQRRFARFGQLPAAIQCFWKHLPFRGRAYEIKFLLVIAAPLISGCAQVNDQFYSKKNLPVIPLLSISPNVNAGIRPLSQLKATSQTVKIATHISTTQ